MRAMKGESMAIEQPVDLNQDASQLYASDKGWHAIDRERESISDPHILPAHRLLPAGKGRLTSNAGADMDLGRFGIYATFH